MIEVTGKYCSGCKETKTIKYWGKNKKERDGLQYYCKQCRALKSKELYINIKIIDNFLVLEKICTRCNILKLSSEFRKQSKSDYGISNICTMCSRELEYIARTNKKLKNKDYIAKNKILITQNRTLKKLKEAELRIVNNAKECGGQRGKNGCHKIKQLIDFYPSKNSFDGHGRICIGCKKKEKASEETKKIRAKWRQLNANKINEQNKIKYSKESNNTSKKLRSVVSKSIRYYLKLNNSSKLGNSFTKFLPYTIAELKRHLESLLEPWMSWDNYGIWKYGDPPKWHIDHIIPQSKLLYDSMNHPNFLKCWSLSNLQPLEARANLSKGAKIVQNY